MAAQPSAAVVESPEVATPPPDARAEAIALVEKQMAAEGEAPEGEAVEEVKPAEESKPAEPPKDERVAKRIAAATRIEQRAAREREDIRTQRTQLEAKGSEIEAREKALAEREAKFTLLEQDPVKAFEVLKLDPKTFLERLAGEHDPNSVLQRELKKEREAREALEKKYEEDREAMKRADADRARARQEAEIRAGEQHAMKAFVGHLESNAERYPHLIEEFTPEEIATQAWKVAVDHAEPYKAQFGEYPEDSVIADYLEAEAQKRAEARNAWRSRLKKTSEPGQGTATTPLGAVKPRTLTNGNASVRATAQKPWNEKDAREEAIKIVQSLHASRVET